MSLLDERHVARTWVELHYPEARGALKAMLITAFGAGVDRGFSESIEAIEMAVRATEPAGDTVPPSA